MPSITKAEYDRLKSCEQKLETSLNGVLSMLKQLEDAKIKIRILERYISGGRID